MKETFVMPEMEIISLEASFNTDLIIASTNKENGTLASIGEELLG